MAESVPLTPTAAATQRPWDARLARWLVTPLKDSAVTPNHLTTVRLAVGLGAAAAFRPGAYGWSNLGAFLMVLSNFLDHTDGELARISGKGSRFGHYYDLASDAVVTVALFVAMGAGVGATIFGALAGVAIALIFLLRMQIEAIAGKAGTRQTSVAGFETEDVLYLLPLVTLCNGVAPFLTTASIGAPLFAIWVVIDYRRALSRHQTDSNSSASDLEPSAEHDAHSEANCMMAERLTRLDCQALSARFSRQGAFLSLGDFAGPNVTHELITAAQAARPSMNRNYIPGHKQGGSVSRHSLDQIAPYVGALYRSPALIDWLGHIAGESLQPSADDDPHAYALYFYTNPGDHIGWHYDTSYYAGRRYTVLLGVIEHSSCMLEYELHTRETGVAKKAGSIKMAPGDLVFFDGDQLRHRITALRQDELRVSLTFEYVTDSRMHPWWRFVSNMKDAVAYFGFRQVFRHKAPRATH